MKLNVQHMHCSIFSLFLIQSVHNLCGSAGLWSFSMTLGNVVWRWSSLWQGRYRNLSGLNLVGWVGVFWWEISPVDGSSQSYVHVNCVHQDGKTLPCVMCCEEADVRNISMRGLLGFFFCCVACKRNYIFCIFSSLGKYIHTQALLPNLSNLYSCKRKLKPKFSPCEMPSCLTLKFLWP